MRPEGAQAVNGRNDDQDRFSYEMDKVDWVDGVDRE